MAQRHRFRSEAPKIRNLRWSRNTFTFANFGAGTAALTFITAGQETDTLMRLRGELLCFLDGTSAPGKLVQIAIGAIVMPEGQGTTVVSSPSTDDTAPWLFYEQFTLGYEEAVTDVISYPGIGIYRKTIDVKAMRILRPDREVQLVVENTTLLSAAAVNLVFGVSGLFGQH